jgi:hypothetical protein
MPISAGVASTTTTTIAPVLQDTCTVSNTENGLIYNNSQELTKILLNLQKMTPHYNDDGSDFNNNNNNENSKNSKASLKSNCEFVLVSDFNTDDSGSEDEKINSPEKVF